MLQALPPPLFSPPEANGLNVTMLIAYFGLRPNLLNLSVLALL
jgi:hypothetical protein